MFIVPRQPLFRILAKVRRVLFQIGQIIKRIDTVQHAGMDDAHKKVADGGAVLCLEEKRIFAVQNSPLESPFAD